MVDLEELRTFIEIVDRGSLRSAALARNVTASLVSRRLAQLEERLGVQLIARTTRSISLTDAGERFEAHARAILDRLSDAVADMHGLSAQPRGHLRIAASHSYGSERVAPVLAKFLQQHPRVVGELVLDDVQADLIGHRFDLAIRIGTLPDSGLVARRLELYSMGLFAAPSYLAAAGTPQRAEELARHQAIELSVAAHHPWRLIGPAGDVQVRPMRRATGSTGHALLRMAEAGLGIIAQPTVLVADALTAGRLVRVLRDYTLPERTAHLIYRKSPQMPAHVRAFIDFATKQLRNVTDEA